MILGTHNSITYMKPRRWWIRPFAWMAKCQTMTLKQQWDAGVRCFDFRVRKASFIDSNAYLCHGIAEYDCRLYEALDMLKELCAADNEQVYVRLAAETGDPNFDVCDLQYKYGSFRWQICSRKNGWSVHYNSFGIDFVEAQESPGNIADAVKGPHALLHKQWDKLERIVNRNCIVSMDFVDEFLGK